MSSAWSVLTSSAATEHETEELLQSTTIAHISWDVVNRDKQTFPKEHNFVDWCRRIALHRGESTGANTVATEHGDLFENLVKDILANELTVEQKKNRRYKLREGMSITTEQRSLVDAILRKNLGDARVALYILEHCIPTLLEAPLLRHLPQRAPMETMLEESRIWYISLLQWLDEQHLAMLKDTTRKRSHEMSATEQRVLEDYDSEKLQNHYDEVRIRKPK